MKLFFRRILLRTSILGFYANKTKRDYTISSRCGQFYTESITYPLLLMKVVRRLLLLQLKFLHNWECTGCRLFLGDLLIEKLHSRCLTLYRTTLNGPGTLYLVHRNSTSKEP